MEYIHLPSLYFPILCTSFALMFIAYQILFYKGNCTTCYNVQAKIFPCTLLNIHYFKKHSNN